MSKLIGSDVDQVSLNGMLGSGAFVDIDSVLSTKQNTLVSGTNIKTVNGQSVLGSGDIIVSGSGGGNSSSSGSVTMTASTKLYTIDASTGGLKATLPSAIGLDVGASLFTVNNTGDYDIKVVDNGGKTLGFVRPKTTAVIGLIDNSTSSGIWAPSGMSKIGESAKLMIQSVLANSTTAEESIKFVSLDANKGILVFGGTTIYAVVYDKVTNAFGSIVLVATGRSSGVRDIRMVTSTTAVLSSASASNIQTVVLSVSGLTISVGTAATIVPSNTITSELTMVKVGTTFVIEGVSSGTTTGILVAFSVSGTTVTMGSPYSVTLGYNISFGPIVLSSTSFMGLVEISSGSIVATVYSLSGTTITETSQDIGNGGGSVIGVRSVLLSSGRVLMVYKKSVSSSIWARLYSISGGIVSATEVQLPSAHSSSMVALSLIGTDKFISVYQNNSALASACRIDCSTGTVSVGAEFTAINYPTSNYSSVAELSTNGNIAKFFIVGSTGTIIPSIISFDGTNSTLTCSVLYSGYRDQYNNDVPGTYTKRNELSAYSISNGDTTITVNSQERYTYFSDVIVNTGFIKHVPSSGHVRGASNREVWAVTSDNTKTTMITLMEMAE